MKTLHGGDIRAARSSDLADFMAIVASLDDPSILFGPGAGGAGPVTASFYEIQFRTPFGFLGYRHASVLDIDGRIAGFSIGLPLDRLRKLEGNSLPEELLKERYGDDLSTVLVINLVAVSQGHRRRGIATRLVRCAVDEAKAKGCRFVMTQCWKRNKASLRSIEEFGFRLFLETTYQLSDAVMDSYMYFDHKC